MNPRKRRRDTRKGASKVGTIVLFASVQLIVLANVMRRSVLAAARALGYASKAVVQVVALAALDLVDIIKRSQT